jgi:hypothetical protein
MADFMYPPKWGDINQVRLKFGLSDNTLAQLTREDASFRRVNGDTVEYDLDKIRNHPKIRAFREKQRSGQATAISYENIIKNVVPRVVLPELTKDQRLYLKTIYDYFHVEGKWPTFLWVENTILQSHPEKRPSFDLAEICKDLPDNFVSKFSFNNQYKDKAMFMVPVLYYFPEAKEEIDEFIKVIGFCVEKMNTFSEEDPVLLSQDLSDQLHMDPLTVRKIGLLLPAEPGISAGGSSNEAEGWWRWGLQRGRYGVRRFEGVTMFEQYLEKRAELTRTFLGKAPVPPIQYEPEIDLSIPDTRLGGTQYLIPQREQQTTSEGVMPSLDKSKIFFCYAHEDKALLKKLQSHLRPLEREGLIQMWFDRDIHAGDEWEQKIDQHLNTADIILLLISPDFMDSEYCYGIEMKKAIERHERGEARVIPIILRSVYWQIASLGKLQALPTDAKPVMSSHWHNLDEAFYDVAEGARKVVEQLTGHSSDISSEAAIQTPKPKPLLDGDALVEEARDLEKQFQANNYTGRSNGPTILEVKGTLPVVLSAPHAVRYGRKNRKQPQVYTGALALQLARLTGASALVNAHTSDEDPNRNEPGLYKPKLAALVRETHARFVLDVHGSDEDLAREKMLGQVEIGTIYSRSLRGKRFLRNILEEALEHAGITATIDKYFTADAPGTITLYTSEDLETPAMQLEIMRSLRDIDHAPQKYLQLLEILREAILAMQATCEEKKN